MERKTPIDSFRESSGSVDVGTTEDGAIVDSMILNGRLLTIKERAVYEVRLADEIDPQREHPNIPRSSQRLIIGLGTESEIFSRTFLTAKRLFQPQFLLETIDTSKSLSLVLEIVIELDALNKRINEYKSEERKAVENFEDRKSKNLDHAVPSIPDIKTQCNTIFQKADHVLQKLMDLNREFYSEFGIQYYTKFAEFIMDKYGDQDDFTKFINRVLPFIVLVRDIRNCLEHIERTETKIRDFEFQLDLNIVTPTIEVDFKTSKLDKTSLYSFLEHVNSNLLLIVENILPYLCNKHTKAQRGIPAVVSLIPEERRTNRFIKFAYWSPLGEGGYFHQ